MCKNAVVKDWLALHGASTLIKENWLQVAVLVRVAAVAVAGDL